MVKAPTRKTASKLSVGALNHDDANRKSVPTAAWRFAKRCPSASPARVATVAWISLGNSAP